MSDLLPTLMDPRYAALLLEALLRFGEIEKEKKREKTRLMEESLRADKAALKAKKTEQSLLRMLADKEALEKLVADFLEVDGNLKDFDAKTMMASIGALISPDVLDGIDGGGFGGVNGVDINCLANTQNLDKYGAIMATVEGTKVDGDLEKDGAVMATVEGTKADADPDKDEAVTATIRGTKVDPVELIVSETGVVINCLANTQNLDKDGAVMATIGGTKVDGGAVVATIEGTKVDGE